MTQWRFGFLQPYLILADNLGNTGAVPARLESERVREKGIELSPDLIVEYF